MIRRRHLVPAQWLVGDIYGGHSLDDFIPPRDQDPATLAGALAARVRGDVVECRGCDAHRQTLSRPVTRV
jgi:hypothetical protein